MRNSDYKTLFDQTFKRLPIIKIWGIILIATLVSIILIAGLTVLNPKDKEISVVNYYQENIILEINNHKETLEPFEAYSRVLNTNRPIKITAHKENSEVLVDFTSDFLGLRSKLIMIALSPQLEYCFFKQNVTSLYYLDEDKNELTNSIVTATTINTPKISLLDTNESNAKYVYPGSSNIDELTNKFYKENLIGVYPIVCSEIENKDKQKMIIQAFVSYDHTKQSSFLEEKTGVINSIGSVSELEGVIF